MGPLFWLPFISSLQRWLIWRPFQHRSSGPLDLLPSTGKCLANHAQHCSGSPFGPPSQHAAAAPWSPCPPLQRRPLVSPCPAPLPTTYAQHCSGSPNVRPSQQPCSDGLSTPLPALEQRSFLLMNTACSCGPLARTAEHCTGSPFAKTALAMEKSSGCFARPVQYCSSSSLVTPCSALQRRPLCLACTALQGRRLCPALQWQPLKPRCLAPQQRTFSHP